MAHTDIESGPSDNKTAAMTLHTTLQNAQANEELTDAECPIVSLCRLLSLALVVSFVVAKPIIDAISSPSP